jgi:hypothetical protein
VAAENAVGAREPAGLVRNLLPRLEAALKGVSGAARGDRGSPHPAKPPPGRGLAESIEGGALEVQTPLEGCRIDQRDGLQAPLPQLLPAEEGANLNGKAVLLHQLIQLERSPGRGQSQDGPLSNYEGQEPILSPQNNSGEDVLAMELQIHMRNPA